MKPFTASQEVLLAKAKYYGDMIGWPETIQAILLVESNAGKGGRVGDDGRSLGVMQMQPDTAAYTTSQYEWLPNVALKEYSTRLLKDDDYAVFLGALYFKLCLKKHTTWSRAVVCYNRGLKGKYSDTDRYLAKVRKAILTVRAYNERKESKVSTTNDTIKYGRITTGGIYATSWSQHSDTTWGMSEETGKGFKGSL